MKGLLCYPEMLDNSNAPRVLKNSDQGHLIAYQVGAFIFLCAACQSARFFSYKMFNFRRAASCSLWLIAHHFPTATVSGSPLPLQQTHKKVGRVHLVQSGQVKHECNCFQMWHRSLVWGVCVCTSMLKWTHQKVPTSCINLVSAPFHSSVPWIVSLKETTQPRLNTLYIVWGVQKCMPITCVSTRDATLK